MHTSPVAHGNFPLTPPDVWKLLRRRPICLGWKPPKMATATPSTNLKAETRPLFPRGLPYSPSPFNVKQFLWPSFTPLKKRKRELSGWIQVGVHLLGSSPSLNLSNGAVMNKQRIPQHLYFGLNIAQSLFRKCWSFSRRSGRIILSHKSSNPYDRPTIQQILDAVATAETGLPQ